MDVFIHDYGPWCPILRQAASNFFAPAWTLTAALENSRAEENIRCAPDSKLACSSPLFALARVQERQRDEVFAERVVVHYGDEGGRVGVASGGYALRVNDGAFNHKRRRGFHRFVDCKRPESFHVEIAFMNSKDAQRALARQHDGGRAVTVTFIGLSSRQTQRTKTMSKSTGMIALVLFLTFAASGLTVGIDYYSNTSGLAYQVLMLVEIISFAVLGGLAVTRLKGKNALLALSGLFLTFLFVTWVPSIPGATLLVLSEIQWFSAGIFLFAPVNVDVLFVIGAVFVTGTIWLASKAGSKPEGYSRNDPQIDTLRQLKENTGSLGTAIWITFGTGLAILGFGWGEMNNIGASPLTVDAMSIGGLMFLVGLVLGIAWIAKNGDWSSYSSDRTPLYRTPRYDGSHGITWQGQWGTEHSPYASHSVTYYGGERHED